MLARGSRARGSSCGFSRWIEDGSESSAGLITAVSASYGRLQIDADRLHRKMLGDGRRVALVLRIAVAGHQHGDHFAWRRQLGEPRDDRRIDPA